MTWARRGNKFHARTRLIEGVNVGSEKEARRVLELKLLERAGEIHDLEFHPRFELVVNGTRIGHMTPDSRYTTKDGEVIVEDVKSPVTARAEAYRLRRKVFEAVHWPLQISEV